MNDRRAGQRGQALVMFIVVFLGLAGMAGLLLDGGVAWVNRREAQTAADLAAMAAGKAVTDAKATCDGNGLAIASAAAQEAAALNGFSNVTVSYPATGTAARPSSPSSSSSSRRSSRKRANTSM